MTEETETAEWLDPRELHDSTLQTRKKYKAIDELAASMKGQGCLQSLLVRPHPDKKGEFELVAGHRRKRGAIKAKLEVVPVIIREMTDSEVLDAMIVENNQREDVNPVEELGGYLGLVQRGAEPEEIAARIGRPVGYVYRRLQLDKLCKSGKEALLEGRMRLGIAELIARLADEETQERAVVALCMGEHSEPTIGMARDWIERNCTMLLKKADFDTNDALLVAKAGACGVCPKNSAKATMLFPDMEEARCTDSTCYQAKRDQTWALRITKAEAKGITVLDEEQTKKAFPYDGTYPSRYWIDLDSHDHVDGKRKKWRTIIGKDRMPDVFLARSPRGTIYELVKRSVVKKAAKAAPKPNDPFEIAKGSSKREDAEKRTQKIKKQFEHQVLHDVARSIDKTALPGDLVLWRSLAHGILARSWAATISLACKRRKLMPNKENNETNTELLHRYIEAHALGLVPGTTNVERTATIKDVQVLALELLVVPEFNAESPFLGQILKRFKIDRKAELEDATHRIDSDAKMKQDKADAKAAGKDVDSHRAAKRAKAKTNGKKEPEEVTPDAVMKLITGGMSYAAAGKELGLSKHQVARMVKKAKG